jgi:hypothetical protein
MEEPSAKRRQNQNGFSTGCKRVDFDLSISRKDPMATCYEGGFITSGILSDY